MPFGLGFFATAGGAAPVAAGDYDLLTTTIVGSTAVASVVFDVSTYASEYRHLQIRAVARSSRASNDNDGIAIRFNSDTASNYSWHGLEGRSGQSTPIASAAANTSYISTLYSASAATSGTNTFGATVIDILDAYSTTKNKTVRALSGNPNASRQFVFLTSGAWRNTNALSSITIFPEFNDPAQGNWVQYSRFSLYGLKG